VPRRAAPRRTADKMVVPLPPTLAVRRAGAAAFRARHGVERANGDITLYVMPEIVKNTDVQKMPCCHPSCYNTVSILLTCNEQQYRCLSVSAADPLECWRTQTETYRRLSHLACAVLAIPATSAPSERIFFQPLVWC